MKEKGSLIDGNGKEWPIQGEGWICIGRFPQRDKGIPLTHQTISKLHARIREKEGFELQDMNSKNGTFINGIRLKSGECRKLSDGDKIDFGEMEFRFKLSFGGAYLTDLYGMKRDCFFTINGKKLRFILLTEEPVFYQLNMINENEVLCVPECYFVQSIGENALLYDVTELISLKDFLEIQKPDWIGLLDFISRITELVCLGTRHMLEPDQYAITEETIFLTSLHNDKKNIGWKEVKIIYFPKSIDQKPGFVQELSELSKKMCEKMICPREREKMLMNVIQKFGENPERLLRELIFLEGESDLALRALERVEEEKDSKVGNGIRFQEFDLRSFLIVLNCWKVPLLSTLLFVTALFADLLNVTELVGFGIVLVGFNGFFLFREETGKEE